VTKTVKSIGRWVVLALVLAATFTPAPPASAVSRCNPTTQLAYDAERAVYSFSYPSCGRSAAMGRVRVTVSIERCAQTCATERERTVCRAAGRCSLRVEVAHPPVEVAEYVARASYRSTGKTVVAGARTAAMSCVTGAVTWLCV
jgi:hypothetical protein